MILRLAILVEHQLERDRQKDGHKALACTTLA